MIHSGGDLDPRDHDDRTPLHLTIQSNSRACAGAYRCIVALLEVGADPNAYHKSLGWPLHMAFRHFGGKVRLEVVRKLHEYGARLDVCRNDGTTLLHLVAYVGDVTMVQYLLDAGIPPTSLGNHGQTPLHDCVRSKPIDHNGEVSKAHLESICRIVQILADAGSTAPFTPYARELPNTEGMQGLEHDPITDEISQSRNLSVKARVVKLLKKRQEKQAEKRKKEQTERANEVLGYGVTVFQDEGFRTPLELAVLRRSDQEVLGCLLEIHRNAMVQSGRTQESQTLQNLEADTKSTDILRSHQAVIDASWAAAVGCENWLAVQQFLTQEVRVDLDLLRWPADGRFLEYCIKRNNVDLLQLFLNESSAAIHSRMLVLRSQASPDPSELSTEFCVDLYYLWSITRKVRHDLVLGDDNDDGFPGITTTPLSWEKYSTININFKGGAKARKKVSMSFTKAIGWRRSTKHDHPLRVIWSNVLGMDFQTANFYFGTIGEDPPVIPSLSYTLEDVKYGADSNRLHRRLLDLVGIYAATIQFPACIDDTEPYSCAPRKTSIPFGLIHDVMASKTYDSKRARRFQWMVKDYHDLITVIKNSDFRAYVIEFDREEDERWFFETSARFQPLLLWLNEIKMMELVKILPSQ